MPVPQEYRQFGDRVVLQDTTDFWISDGSTQGTFPVGKFCNGCSVTSAFVGSTAQRIYWLASAPEGRRSLWTSDASLRGAALVDESLEFGFGTPEDSFHFSGETVYFGAHQGSRTGIFRYNPGEGPPVLLQAEGFRTSFILAEFAEFGGRIYFFANGEQTPGLWETDGTVAGTGRVFDFGSAQRDPEGLTRIGNLLYFFADEGRGVDLWVSDGTSAGTRRLTAITTFSFPMQILEIEDSSGRAFFTFPDANGDPALWTSDGTPAGTRPITDFGPSGGLGTFGPQGFAAVGDSILFIASESFGEPGRLWIADRTTLQTRPLFPEGQGPELDFNDFRFETANGRVFFPVIDPLVQQRLWVSDGTEGGTVPVEEICGVACGGIVTAMTEIDGILLFLRADGPGSFGTLWRTDGTAAGSRALLTDSRVSADPLFSSRRWIGRVPGAYLVASTIEPYGDALIRVEDSGDISFVWPLGQEPEGSTPLEFGALGDELAFTARAPDDRFVFRSLYAISPDTLAVRELLPGFPWDDFSFAPEDLKSTGPRLFLRSNNRGDLWSTDGTPGGTFRIWESDFDRTLNFHIPVGSEVFFGVSDSNAGCELWRSDGTVSGTRLVTELGTQFCSLGHPAEVGGDLYFLIHLSSQGGENRVLRLRPQTGQLQTLATQEDVFSLPDFDMGPHFTAFGDSVYFVFEGALWRSRPGVELASQVFSLENGGVGSALAALDGQLFFLAFEFREMALWKTDGTPEGSMIIRSWDIPRDLRDLGVNLVQAEGSLWFPAYEEATGIELWKSNGSTGGTLLAGDLEPGPTSSRPRSFLVTPEGKLFFNARDRFHGRELWIAKGPDSLPRIVQDLHPGPNGGATEWRTFFDDALWLSANDGLRGLELWRLPQTDLDFTCKPGPERLCLQDERFAVEALWRDFQDRTGTGKSVALTADTGYFWFFDEENVESVLKILDGRGNNNHFWSFYGALSNVEYFLTVTDTETGAARRYFNPLGNFASVGDARSFGPRGAGIVTDLTGPPEGLPAVEAIVTESFDTLAAREGCVPASTRLCLQGGRFSVEARWTDFRGNQGVGQAVELTGDTGYFWFFRDTNVETVLKVLDGRPNNGNFWVFYGALSNVDYDLIVTDTMTGAVKTYQNRDRTFASVGDTMAFPSN